MSDIKYLIKPGYVNSRSDGDEHYIGYAKLIQLYRVNPKECLMFEDEMRGYTAEFLDSLTVLEPQYNGNYEVKS